MDIAYGSDFAKKFVTNVGLITSSGKYGQNIMACEWTHHISYVQGLIAICVNRENESYNNIHKSKEFGVNLCATNQTVLSSVAGGNTGREYDKIAALKELGFEFYKAKKINVVMVKGASLNVECKVIQEIALPEHTLFIGQTVEVKENKGKQSLGFHAGMYWRLEQQIPKPSDKQKARIKEVVQKHKR